MSLISPTTTTNTPEPKTEPAAAETQVRGGGVVGGIVHLTIPIVIPSVKMEGTPSIAVPPLIISSDNDNNNTKKGSLPAIKAEQGKEPNSAVGADVDGTIDSKKTPAKDSILISIDVIKDDTLSAIRTALGGGRSIVEVQKVTKERKHTWKEILTRSGMSKTDFKSLWAEVRRYCEDKHREDVASTNNVGANSASACKSEHDDCTDAAEVTVKAEPDECHVPLKKRKLPSDYAASVSFDQVSMISSAVIKKMKVENSDSHDRAETHPEGEPAVINIKVEEPEEEAEASSINFVEEKREEEDNTGSSRTAESASRNEKLALPSWKCYKCKEDNEGDNFRCKSCRAWKDGHRLWICKRCRHKNEGVKKRCSACKGWKNGHRPPSSKKKRVIRKSKKEDSARASSSKNEEKKSADNNPTDTRANRTQGPSLQDVLEALAGDDEDTYEDMDDFGIKMEEANIHKEIPTSTCVPTEERKRKKKRFFEFGAWDTIEFFRTM